MSKKSVPYTVDSSDPHSNLSLSKFFGKEVKDVHGYITAEEQENPFFQITKVIFSDGSEEDIEGDYDRAFVEFEYGSKEEELAQEILEENWREDGIWEEY